MVAYRNMVESVLMGIQGGKCNDVAGKKCNGCYKRMGDRCYKLGCNK